MTRSESVVTLSMPPILFEHFLTIVFYTVLVANRVQQLDRARDLLIEFYDIRLRPYHVEYTSSRPITEVKQRRARLVLGWVTAWEYRVS